MAEIKEHHWLALCLLTESDRPEEWPWIAAVIRNRVMSTRYPDTYAEVILQKNQFSAFNKFTRPGTEPRKTFRLVVKSAVDSFRFGADDLVAACDWARDEIRHPPEHLLGGSVLHYYSPVSMVPKFSAPAWAKTAKRLFTPEGIDPKRFIFCEGVA